MSNRTLNSVLLAVIAVLLAVVTVLLLRPPATPAPSVPQQVTVPAATTLPPNPGPSAVSPAYVQPAPNQPSTPVQVTPPVYSGASSPNRPVSRPSMPTTNWTPNRSGMAGPSSAVSPPGLASHAEFQAFVQWVGRAEGARTQFHNQLKTVVANSEIEYMPLEFRIANPLGGPSDSDVQRYAQVVNKYRNLARSLHQSTWGRIAASKPVAHSELMAIDQAYSDAVNADLNAVDFLLKTPSMDRMGLESQIRERFQKANDYYRQADTELLAAFSRRGMRALARIDHRALSGVR